MKGKDTVTSSSQNREWIIVARVLQTNCPRPANMGPSPPLDCWLKLAKGFAGPQTHFMRLSRNWQALLK